ncbi:MAG: helicase-related protein [Planctomycetota bacterium]|nr:helicase-related protein [Planctomycetota bacterium]
MSKAPNRSTPDPSEPSLSESRPRFVDNRDGNTLSKALKQHLVALQQEQALPWGLDIATAFFNLQGFDLIAGELEDLGRVRLMLGAEPVPESCQPQREPGDPDEPEWTQRQVGVALDDLDEGLVRERDLLPFDGETDAAVRRLLGYLHSGKVEVRRYTKGFLHAKAYIFRTAGGGLVVGSSNLTYAGLRRNAELNLGHYEDRVVGRVEQWYDELWDRAEPYDLAGVYDRLMAEYDPYLIYLKVLWHLYGAELVEEAEETADGEIPVTTYQLHGIWRAKRIMEKYGGVLVADGVGLGKTFLAGDIIRQYREQRQRVLLICPAALRDTTWKEFIDRFELFIDCVSFEQLAGDGRLNPKATGSTLKYDPDDYALVVIDEAHNYRNPDSPARAGVLRQLLLGPRRHLLLLTATPVNNSLWDLFHIIRYFAKQDAILADRGVLSIKKRFEQAMAEDPFDLHPDLLYPIIDAMTVKRTRRFIKKHYPGDTIKLDDGTVLPIQFPKPIPSSIEYDLGGVLPGFIDELEEALGPEEGEPLLVMARYQPDRYRLEAVDEEEERRYGALVGLLRCGLLKRFESSVYAFAKTTQKMVREHDAFLEQLERGLVVRKELLREISVADDDEVIEDILAGGDDDQVESAEDFDVARLKADVESDRALLDGFAKRARQVCRADDPKLKALVEELAQVAAHAEADATDEDDAQQKRKVLVFSAFEDTIDWVQDHLEDVMVHEDALAVYRERLGSVSGSDSRRGLKREEAIRGFAPVSTKAPAHLAQDRIDLLLSTDVLAEGMNLQQCRNIINYDLPWNPMRLVQRHGRIDRINSPHARVFLRTFFPDEQLNILLDLERRVRQKLAQAAASVGVEVTPIEHGAQSDRSFAETRKEIEKLREGDAGIYERGGTVSAAQTGEEYRQELREALKRLGSQITDLPWKAGSGMVKGERQGHFFCAQVGERVYLRFVPADDGQIVGEIGTCLRLIECCEETERIVPDDMRLSAYSAWEHARQDILEAWTFETDPANLQPKVSRFNRKLAEYLRANPPIDIEKIRLERCLEATEAPCPIREQRALREVFEQEFASQAARSRAIVLAVERLGLEPFHSPEPLPPINVEQVLLVCWLGLIEESQSSDED